MTDKLRISKKSIILILLAVGAISLTFNNLPTKDLPTGVRLVEEESGDEGGFKPNYIPAYYYFDRKIHTADDDLKLCDAISGHYTYKVPVGGVVGFSNLCLVEKVN